MYKRVPKKVLGHKTSYSVSFVILKNEMLKQKVTEKFLNPKWTQIHRICHKDRVELVTLVVLNLYKTSV